MPTDTFKKFDCLSEDVHEKVHNFASDVFKWMLTNVAPLATNTLKANITEIAAGNGYTAGGNVATLVSSQQTAGVYKLVLSDTTFTASGGNIAAFRYAVLYNSTAAGNPLVGWVDSGSSQGINDGDSFVIDLDPVNGIYTNG